MNLLYVMLLICSCANFGLIYLQWQIFKEIDKVESKIKVSLFSKYDQILDEIKAVESSINFNTDNKKLKVILEDIQVSLAEIHLKLDNNS